MLSLPSSETPRNSLPDFAAKTDLNIGDGIKTLGSNHRPGELVNVSRWIMHEPRPRVRRQTKAQVNAQPA